MNLRYLKQFGLLSTTLLAGALCSCRDEEAQTKIAQLEANLAAQKEAHGKFVEAVVARDKQISQSITALGQQAFKTPQDNYAVIDPNGQGFSMAQSNNGTFLVSCKGAEPYLDGHKLILNIGNPYYMTYSGFTLKAKFGTRPPEYPTDAPANKITEWQEKYNEWENALKEKDLSFTDELAAGAWSKVEMVLSPTKPEEVAYVRISMKTNEVSLRKPKE